MSRSSKEDVPKIKVGEVAISPGRPTGEMAIVVGSGAEGASELEVLGGAGVLAREESQFREDQELLRLHFDELVGQYPDQWIAIFMGKVVAADKELEGLAGKLRLEGFPLSRVVVDYMTERKGAMVL